MYTIYDISEDQAEQLLRLQEDYLNDVKAKEIKPSKLSETVSAFANAAGGTIYVGIKENSGRPRSWEGFSTVEEVNEHIHTLLKCHELGNHVKFEFLHCPSKAGLLLQIQVFKVKEIVKSSSGEIFVRENAGRIKIDNQDKLNKLKLDKGVNSFENEWVESPWSAITDSLVTKTFMNHVIPKRSSSEYFASQHLIKESFVKVAGLVLFSDEPAVYLPKRSSIKVLRYKTKQESIEREFLVGNPITIEGNAYSVIKNSVIKTKEMIEEINKLASEGLEEIKYPEETLHEIITNAVLHRDYSIAADIQVRIYDNRIEVESPGRLPGHVTVKNILDTQCARNPTMVRIINKFPDPPNKDVGEGLNTAFDAMRNLKLKDPIILEKNNSVLVKIPHEPLASPEQIVMEYVEKSSEITNRKARELTGIRSENSMKNVFLRLKNRGDLEPIPGREIGPNAAWRKKIK